MGIKESNQFYLRREGQEIPGFYLPAPLTRGHCCQCVYSDVAHLRSLRSKAETHQTLMKRLVGSAGYDPEPERHSNWV